MSKYHGLSHLADVARDLTQPGEACYPVRRKGERRRLNPNQAGIDWLEGRCTDGRDFLDATEIVDEDPAGEVIGEDSSGEQVYEYRALRARGAYAARSKGLYVRPIFQTLHPGRGSGQSLRYPAPCPDCDDWSRTSRCAQHHDRDGIEGLGLNIRRGAELRRAIRERTVTAAETAWHAEAANDMPERHFSHVTIEVNGETVQGVRSLSYQVARDGHETPTWRY